MAKVKKTKTSLKQQRDALARYKRYLPTLELKKQQLRSEVSRMEKRIEEKAREQEGKWQEMEPWLHLFADSKVDDLVEIEDVETRMDNVAGVAVPAFEAVRFNRSEWDLFATDPWLDDGVLAVESLVELRVQEKVLEEARDRIAEELRITTQRVNLFEKVKIPECEENIRVIQISLADEQTAAVVRSKIAKEKVTIREHATT